MQYIKEMREGQSLGYGKVLHKWKCRKCGEEGKLCHAISREAYDRLQKGLDWEECGFGCDEPPADLMIGQGDLNFEEAFKVGLAGII